jgi:hypothetical protein
LAVFQRSRLGSSWRPRPFDVEQGLLQHHQLRLDLDVETAGGLEEAQENAAERDFVQRAVEDRFADGADGGLELVGTGIGRRPAGFDVRHRDALVVALEESKKVLREIVLVVVGERADDAEIERDIAAVMCRVSGDEDVAGVHVGMEEAVAKDLGEKDLDAGARQRRQIDAGGDQRVGLTDRDAPHALHDHHRRRALIPVHFGHLQQPRTAEVAPQLRAVGGFAHQVEFVVEILGELADDFARLQPLAVRPDLFEQTGEGVEQRQIAGNDAVHAGAQDLDRDLVAPVLGPQAGEMDLGDRGAGHRRRIEFGKHLTGRPAIGLLDLRQGERRRERRHAILQLREFVGDVGRQQITTGGQTCPNLTKIGPSDSSAWRRRTADGVSKRRQKCTMRATAARRPLGSCSRIISSRP